MKNLLLIASFVFLGACSNYTTGNAMHTCCADAAADGRACACCDDMDQNAKAMSAGSAAALDECCADAAANGKSCCAEMTGCAEKTGCDTAAAADSCNEKMAAMACCAEAKAKGVACAECAKP